MPALYTANELPYVERMFDAAIVETADIETVLRTRFGLTEFRPGQRQVIEALPDTPRTAAVRLPVHLRARYSGNQPGRGFFRLVAMLPVNVRRPEEHLQLGNRVSMMVAPLPVGIFDPLERFRQVRAATGQLKERGQAAHMTRLVELLEMLPPAMQKPIAWLQVQAPPVNTVCTNVPGPPVSLYVQGHRLETLVPVVPLAQGVGMAFAILSYADTLTIGVTVDPALVPDSDIVADLLVAGFEELRALAGVERAARREPIRPELQRRRATPPSQVA